MPNKKPIFDPFSNDLPTFIDASIRRALYDLHTCIPAIVKKVIGRNYVVVSPAVQQIDSEWKSVEWADVKLPVHTPSGSNVLFSVPLAVGDTGWIIAGDLDPSLFFKDTSKPARQNVLSRHNYQFGFFIPDIIRGISLSADDDGGIFIGTEDGSTKVLIKDGEISIVGKSELKIRAENVSIDGSSKVIINGTDWKTHTHTVPSNIKVQVNTGTGTGATTETTKTGGVD